MRFFYLKINLDLDFSSFGSLGLSLLVSSSSEGGSLSFNELLSFFFSLVVELVEVGGLLYGDNEESD